MSDLLIKRQNILLTYSTEIYHGNILLIYSFHLRLNRTHLYSTLTNALYFVLLIITCRTVSFCFTCQILFLAYDIYIGYVYDGLYINQRYIIYGGVIYIYTHMGEAYLPTHLTTATSMKNKMKHIKIKVSILKSDVLDGVTHTTSLVATCHKR